MSKPCNRFNKIRHSGKWFVLPAVIVIGLLLIYPVCSSIFYSFTSKHLIKPKWHFVGFANYISILTDKAFWNSFFNNIKWTAASLACQLLVGFSAALALEKVRKFKGFFRTMLIIPWAFPSIVIALSWKWILNGVSGFIPNILYKLGLVNDIPQFLSTGNSAFWTLIFINTWFGAPLIMVNVLSALQTVSKDQYEAAQVDGAGALKSFLYITLPHIKTVVGLLVVLRTIWVFNSFDMIYLITGGGPGGYTETVPLYAYNVGWGLKQLGKSSAVTIILLAFLLLVSSFYFRILNKWDKEDE